MKRQTVSLFALLLAASGFFFSCGNTANKNTGALEFDSLQVDETAHLFGDTAKPACNLTVSLVYASRSADTRLKDSLNTYFLSTVLGEAYGTLAPEAAVKRYTDAYVDEYRQSLEPLYLEDEQNQEDNARIGAWYSYYKGMKGSVQLYEKELLVYRIDYNEYTGGAHGIYATTFLNLDLRTLAPLRLDDLFVEDYREPLTDLLWQQLLKDIHVDTRDEAQDMGYATTGALEPIENFYLDREGITFYYNVYEITPYAMGPVTITLPYEAIGHLLSDGPGILKSVK